MLDYMFEGWRRRLYLGNFPDWTTVEAREHAKLRQVQNRSRDRLRKPRHLSLRFLLQRRSSRLAQTRGTEALYQRRATETTQT
jgi:hypothetical protein